VFGGLIRVKVSSCSSEGQNSAGPSGSVLLSMAG
jgi:hypothetical protein